MEEFVLTHFANLGLSLSGILFIGLITVVYLLKKNYHTFQKKLYTTLLFTTLILLILDIVSSYTITARDSIPLINNIVCRLFLISNILAYTIIVIDAKIIFTNKEYNNIKELLKDKSTLIYSVISIIILAISCSQKIEYTQATSSFVYIISKISNITIASKSTCYNVGGPAVNSLYIILFMAITYLLIILFKNINRKNLIKFFPFIFFFALYTILGLFQIYYIDFANLSYIYAFCVVAMYFTVENPEIRLVEELQKSQLEAQQADKENAFFINEISRKIKSPINIILGYSEMIDNKSPEEQKQKLEIINETSKKIESSIEDIVTYWEITNNKELLEEKYSINELCNNISKHINKKINHNNSTLKINLLIPNNNYIGDNKKIYLTIIYLLNILMDSEKNNELIIDIDYNSCDKDIDEIQFSLTNKNIKNTDNLNNINNYLNNENIDTNNTNILIVIVKKIIKILDAKLEINNKDISTTLTIKIKQKKASVETR